MLFVVVLIVIVVYVHCLIACLNKEGRQLNLVDRETYPLIGTESPLEVAAVISRHAPRSQIAHQLRLTLRSINFMRIIFRL